MTASLPVELNRGRLHDISAPGAFSTDRSFRVELTNHGEAVHVHVHLDDDLSRVAHLPEGNHFVQADSTTPVDVVITEPPERVSGKLKIVTGYGAETHYVDVTVEPREEEPRSVDVDESLSKPPQPDPEPSLAESVAAALPGSRIVPLVVLALVAVGLAAAVVFFAQIRSPPVLLGVGVVLGVVVAALVFAAR